MLVKGAGIGRLIEFSKLNSFLILTEGIFKA
jgi:hypothetical protein